MKTTPKLSPKTEVQFEMQFLSHCYNTQVELWKDDSQLGCAFGPIHGSTIKSNFLLPKSPNFVVLVIDFV